MDEDHGLTIDDPGLTPNPGYKALDAPSATTPRPLPAFDSPAQFTSDPEATPEPQRPSLTAKDLHCSSMNIKKDTKDVQSNESPLDSLQVYLYVCITYISYI